MNLSTVTTQSMTSLEIAELVEKRHDNVKRTIETLVKQGVITFPQIEEKPTAGRPITFCVFTGEQGKRDSIIVVAQLCPEFTARLVDRWQELEAQYTKATNPMELLSNPVLLREALLGYSEKVIELESQVAEMQPDVIAYHRIAVAENSLCITDAAKHLQLQPKKFTAFLMQNHWVYKRYGTSYIGYQDKIQQGLLEHKLVQLSDERLVTQCRITPRGLVKLAKLLAID